MKRINVLSSAFAICLSALVLDGCAISTTLQSHVLVPAEKVTAFNKLAVFVIAPDKGKSRIAASIISKQLGPVASPGYTILRPEDEGSQAIVAARLTELGYDAALTVRLLSVEDKKRYVPPMLAASPTSAMPGYISGYGFYNYYGMMYQQTYVAPGYEVNYKDVITESIVYSLKLNDAVWMGTSETIDPHTVTDAAEDLGNVISSALSKAGLLRN